MAIHMMNDDPGTHTRATTKRRVIAAGALALAAAAVLGMVVLHGRPAPSGAAGSHVAGDDTGRIEAAAEGDGAVEMPHRAVKSVAAVKPRAIVSSSALPANVPLAKIYDELKARADAGDAQAASQLYRDLHRCAIARESLRALPRYVNQELDEDTSKLDADQLTRREAHLASMEERLTKARTDNESCGDLTEAQLLLTPIAQRAAQLGDVSAINCYVGGAMMYGQGILDHPEWLAQYKADALNMAMSAVSQGDWRMIAQLQRAYAGGLGANLLGQVTGSDPAQAYRYMKLRQLGSSDEKAAYFGKELSYAAQGLSDSDISSGDAWAQDAYQRYFSANPVNNVMRNVNACQDE
jgi:hypothetical protein